jgi:CRISPR-associated protein Csb1
MSDKVKAQALNFTALKDAVSGSAAAFRCRRRLQPAGGEGDKVFPPTFAGAVYAVEQRRVPGRQQPATCVLLDSVQSQANRMELALQDALDAERIKIPVLVVDFTDYAPTGDVEADVREGRLIDAIGKVTSLQVPHRLADAILRDSQIDGKDFRESGIGKALNTVSTSNATPVLELCPTALVFGMWDSTGPKGGLGPKFERALVSEVIGIGAEFGLKTQSRIDPLITTTKGIVLYNKRGGGWTLDEAEAQVDEKTGKSVKLGKDGKASEANLGNVTPAFHKYTRGAEGADPLRSGTLSVDYSIRANTDEFRVRNQSKSEASPAREGQIAPGGVTIEYAEQMTTLSLICLRRLRFPINRVSDKATDNAARTVLAALGLCAATLAFESGLGLRSRCLLWPDEEMEWELLDRPGAEPKKYSLTADQAIALLNESIAAAKDVKMPWREEPALLKPKPDLLKLVRLSQVEATKEGAQEGS